MKNSISDGYPIKIGCPICGQPIFLMHNDTFNEELYLLMEHLIISEGPIE